MSNVQTITSTTETQSVPIDMLALRTVQQPIYITVPGASKITVTSHSNASYEQKVTIKDVANGTTHTFTGSGENASEMVLNGKEAGGITLQALEAKPLYRTLSVFSEYSRPNTNGRWEESSVLYPRSFSNYEAPNHLKSLSWEIFTEDGGDNDYNDSVIRIEAEVDQKL